MEFHHVSVLLNECIENLNIKPDGVYVDCTMGGAGHSKEIVKRLSDKGLFIGFDQDKNAIATAKERLSEYSDRVRFVHSNFENIKEELAKIGIEVPRLYKMGFSHNNCGGFCCKAGQGHWVNVLEKMPEKFKEYEEKEHEIIKYIGKDVSMMKKIRNGKAETYTLKQLKEDYEKDKSQIDLFDIGGCGCFSEEE